MTKMERGQWGHVLNLEFKKMSLVECHFFQFFKGCQPLSYIRKRKEQIQLVGPLASCANITVRKPHTSLKKKKQWHDILRGKRKNLPVQRAVIFTQGDSWTARSLLRRAPKTSGKEQMFSLLLMQNRWEWLFKTFFGAGGGWGGHGEHLPLKIGTPNPFLASQSIKIFTQRCRLEI